MSTGSFQSMTDEELVRLVLSGKIQAYNTLVKRFRGAVVRVAEQTLASREVAEDVAQEVFLVAFQSLTRLREPQRFAHWLYAITRYRARRVRQQEQRTVSMEPDHLYPVTASLFAREPAQPETVLLNMQLKDELDFALLNLKPEFRLVFLLHYEETWPVGRISEFLALPVTTIQWRLHQARKLLKHQILSHRKDTDHE